MPDAQLVECAKAESLAIAAKIAAKIYHEGQTRKGPQDLPYETHLHRVSIILSSVLALDPLCPIAGTDPLLEAGAWLHDALEDKKVCAEQLLEDLGSPELLALCQDLCNPLQFTDIASKQAWQVATFASPLIGPHAKLIKLADQLANIISTIEDPPIRWTVEKQKAYNHKAREVARACRGVSPLLDQLFTVICDQADDLLHARTEKLTASGASPKALIALGREDRQLLRAGLDRCQGDVLQTYLMTIQEERQISRPCSGNADSRLRNLQDYLTKLPGRSDENTAPGSRASDICDNGILRIIDCVRLHQQR